jgi:hypothetical protein
MLFSIRAIRPHSANDRKRRSPLGSIVVGATTEFGAERKLIFEINGFRSCPFSAIGQ